MRRREFIMLVGGATATWPLSARAQQPGKLPTIGFLGTVTQSTWPVEAFAQRLRELGWIDGKTVTVEYRWAEGHSDRITAFAAEFVRSKVDLIVTGGNAVAAAKQATSTIPIIFAVAVDPVGSGFVAAKQELAQVQAAAAALGFDSVVLEIRQAQDIAPAFDGLNDRADALYVVTEALVSSNAARINTLALGERMPTIFGTREGIQAGGLVCYGPNLSALFRRAAEFADKILRGAKPGDIPVEQPTKFELIVNLTTAKALGLTIPPNLLALADEVIE